MPLKYLPENYLTPNKSFVLTYFIEDGAPQVLNIGMDVKSIFLTAMILSGPQWSLVSRKNSKILGNLIYTNSTFYLFRHWIAYSDFVL